jgi:PAS domain S-box-containing protein
MVEGFLRFKKSFLVLSFLIMLLAGLWFALVLNPHSLGSLVAFVLNLVVAVYVFSRDPGRRLYQVFSLWSLVLALDSLLLLGLYIAPSARFARIWAQITGPGYYLIPPTSLHFVLVFTGSTSKVKKTTVHLCYGIAAAFIVLSLTPSFQIHYVKTGPKYSPSGGFLYAASLLTLLAVVSGALFQVIYSYRKTSSYHERNQYKMLFIAGIFAFIVGSSGALLSYGVEIYPLSSLAFTVYALILAYAIVRHRFLDIEVVIKKSVVYASLTLCVAGGYAVVMLVANAVFSVASPTTSIPINAAVIVAIAFVFQPLRTSIQSFVDRKFFREKYSYRETLRRFSNDIITIIGIEELSLRLVTVVTDTVKVANTRLFLRDTESGSYQMVAEKQHGAEAVYYPGELRKPLAQPKMVTHLENMRQILDRDELAYRKTASSRPNAGTEAAGLLNALESMEAHLLMPIVLKGKMTGLFAIGVKLSEEGFSSQDVELLQIILNQTAIAVENSELYDRTLALKRYYDDIVKSMTSGMLTVDKSGQVITLNPAGEQILGLSAGNVRGKSLNGMLGENREFAAVVLEVLEASAQDAAAFRETELEYGKADRKKLAVTASLLSDERAEVIGAVALFSDITEKKELERQLERSRRLAYMGEMAASIAHEIKNPIGSIRLFVDALARDFSNPVAQKNFKEVIPQEVENIDRMVRDLLFLARPPGLNKVRLDLAEIVRVTLRFCSEDAGSRGVAFNTNAMDGSVEVLADGEKLKQALRNIVLNAVEAVPPETGEISVSLAKDARTASVIVADNGPGIEQEDVLRLFHPFYTTKHGGTGLGLAIANRIVEDHGGSIQVASDLGKGTTFSIVLPREDAELQSKP